MVTHRPPHSGGHLYRMHVPDFSGKGVYFRGSVRGKNPEKSVEIGGLLAFSPKISLIRGSFQIFLHLGGNVASFPFQKPVIGGVILLASLPKAL